MKKLAAFIAIFGMLTATSYAQEPKIGEENALSSTMPYYGVQEAGSVDNTGFMQPADAAAINAAALQRAPVAQQPAAQTPLPTSTPTPTTTVLTPPMPDKTTEPEGCTGPANNSKCVTYNGDKRTITYHTKTVTSGPATITVTETEDSKDNETWNYQTKKWDFVWGDVNWSSNTVNTGTFEPIEQTMTQENSYERTYAIYKAGSTQPYSRTVSGSETKLVVDNQGRTLIDNKYTYIGESTNRFGYTIEINYSAAGMSYYSRSDFSGYSTTTITKEDKDVDGTLESCHETETDKDGVVYDADCRAPQLLT